MSLYGCYSHYTYEFFRNGVARCFIGLAAGIVGVGMVFCFPQLRKKYAVILILLISLGVRLAVLPTAASDDVNRYLWEGKLYSQGVSPYAEAAEHAIYEPHRDHFWEDMNHKDKITAYPPLSLYAFGLINQFSYSPMSYKVAFLIADLLLITLIIAILWHYQRPLHWSLLYALSPVSILSFAAEGHFDILMMLFLVFSVLAFSKKWFILCGAAVGLAVATKIMVAIAAPIILIRTGVKGMTAAAVSCSLPFLIHFDDTLQMINGLVSFGSENNFNGLFNQFFDDVVGLTPELSNKICIVLLIALWCIGFWFGVKRKLWLGLLFALGGLILCSPIVHFWYIAWLLPFIAIRPSLPWVSLSITAPCYFLVHSNYLETGHWELPVWGRWMFYLPFLVISILYFPPMLLATYRQLKEKGPIGRRDGSPGWSVVIPTLKIEAQTQLLIEQLEMQSVLPEEVVVVSTSPDDNMELFSDKMKIKLTHSERSRGLQIKTGVEAAECEWCLILHGDNQLAPESFRILNRAIATNVDMIGGALGQRFTRSSPGLILIESMNDFRACLLRTSFGDQNQFFHRATAIDKEVLTDQPLMEDVEMSDRLRRHGETLHLAHESVVSAEKWKPQSFWRRFFTIVGFYFRYRLLFFSAEKRAALSKKFYLKYYPQKEA